MTWIIKNFDSYRIKFWGFNRKGSSDAGRTSVTISLFDGNVLVGHLNFHDYPLSLNLYENNVVTMNFHISYFNDMIDLLRYEKPLQLHFEDRKLGGNIQTISHEPVGEQE
jgi:hypothetical protein